jgi:hypothetical protein
VSRQTYLSSPLSQLMASLETSRPSSHTSREMASGGKSSALADLTLADFAALDRLEIEGWDFSTPEEFPQPRRLRRKRKIGAASYSNGGNSEEGPRPRRRRCTRPRHIDALLEAVARTAGHSQGSSRQST